MAHSFQDLLMDLAGKFIALHFLAIVDLLFPIPFDLFPDLLHLLDMFFLVTFIPIFAEL
jgi:hypothetical protein